MCKSFLLMWHNGTVMWLTISENTHQPYNHFYTEWYFRHCSLMKPWLVWDKSKQWCDNSIIFNQLIYTILFLLHPSVKLASSSFTLDILLCCVYYKVVTNHHQHNYLGLLCFMRWVIQLHVLIAKWSSSGH